MVSITCGCCITHSGSNGIQPALINAGIKSNGLNDSLHASRHRYQKFLFLVLSPSLGPQSWYSFSLQITSVDKNIVESNDYNASDALAGAQIDIVGSFLLADLLDSIKDMCQVVVKWQDPILGTLWLCLQKHRRFFPRNSSIVHSSTVHNCGAICGF